MYNRYIKVKESQSQERRITKMRMSDMIEEFIKDLFDEENNDYIEIQRNDLAEQFNCVPSQINYVISTRFKPSQGYYVESKRGGGGHITIKKINITKSNYIMHIIPSIGDKLTAQEVDIFISNLLSYEIITTEQAKLLKVATSDNVLTIPQQYRDALRASIFKNMLINLV
jgi:transcriptional regulator CtsR